MRSPSLTGRPRKSVVTPSPRRKTTPVPSCPCVCFPDVGAAVGSPRQICRSEPQMPAWVILRTTAPGSRPGKDDDAPFHRSLLSSSLLLGLQRADLPSPARVRLGPKGLCARAHRLDRLSDSGPLARADHAARLAEAAVRQRPDHARAVTTGEEEPSMG